MVAKLRPLPDPRSQQCDLFCGKPLVRILRHDFVRIVRLDPSHQLTCFRIAGYDDFRFIVRDEVRLIQSQVRLAALSVGAVTGVAMVRQNRLNVSAKIDRLRGRLPPLGSRG